MKCFFYLVFCVCITCSYAQDKAYTSYFDVNYFRGNIAEHNPNISHLIIGHPEGIILSWNKKTYGYKKWEQRFNYPDYGVSFTYQDSKNEILGANYAINTHYNFYFFKRNLMFRIGAGLAYTTNPYDKERNYRNVAYASKLMSSPYLMLNYKREHVIDNFGLHAGVSLLHYSNASVKAPNTSTNSIVFNLGINYSLDDEEPTYKYTLDKKEDQSFTEPLKFNFAFRSGINQSDVIGSGQHVFYVLSTCVDKRINKLSAFQLGGDVFFSNFLKELIAYKSVAFPEENLSGDEDYRRIGLFAGHELFINKLTLLTQLGYYVYYPFDFEGLTYVRVGLKRYFYNKYFASITLKSHWAKAEAVEFGIGIRL